MKRVPFIPKLTIIIAAAATAVVVLYACSGPATNTNNVLAGNAASKVYVAPGQYDEYYAFLSGGYNGQVMAYGLPSGRLLKLIGVFSQNPETGLGIQRRDEGDASNDLRLHTMGRHTPRRAVADEGRT
jgi:nitrous oxide reductase